MIALWLWAALWAPPVSPAPAPAPTVVWPAGSTWRVVQIRESDAAFGDTLVAKWERVEQRWVVGTPRADGLIPVLVQGVAGERTTSGRSPKGPIEQRVTFASAGVDPDSRWWQITQQAQRRLWLAPDGQRVVEARWVEGLPAVVARFTNAGGDPEALPMPPEKMAGDGVDPVVLSRMLPRIGPDGWVEARSMPVFLDGVLDQTLRHQRIDDLDGTVDAFDGEGELTGSTALFWMVAVQMNRLHGYSRLDAQRRPVGRVERLEVAGRVLRPPKRREPGQAPYGPLRLDILMETQWALAPGPAPAARAR